MPSFFGKGWLFFIFPVFILFKAAHAMYPHTGKYAPEKQRYRLLFQAGAKYQITDKKKSKRQNPNKSQSSLLLKKSEYIKKRRKQQREEVKQRFPAGKACPAGLS